MAAIGFDIGGTKVAWGPLDNAGALARFESTALPSRDYDVLVDWLGHTARGMQTPGEPAVIGVAMAAWLSADRETVLSAASLGWQDKRLRHDLERRTGFATFVENDANCAVWGEYIEAGRPEGGFVMLTLGTDVGGGVVLDGRLQVGDNGLAGELGHLLISSGGPACVCGKWGCLAVYASGPGMLRGARERLATEDGRGSLLAQMCAGVPTALTSADLSAAAAQGDPVALEVIEDAAEAIAIASEQISRVIDHKTLILGGGAAATAGLVNLSATAVSEGASGPSLTAPEVRMAATGNAAGVLGAAHIARDRSMHQRGVLTQSTSHQPGAPS